MLYDNDFETTGMETSRNKISVILADDHPLMREALRINFRKHADFEIAGEAVDGEEAVRLAVSLKPDVVIMDISMPKLSGIEATRQIKAQCPATSILVLSVHNDYERILGILSAGASGYLTKDAIGEEIVKAARIVHSGETILSSPVSQELIKYAVRNTTQPLVLNQVDKLTPRDIDILKLAAKGMGNKDIAQRMNLSVPTIKSYFAEIFSKLNASSRTEAVIAGLRAGFLTLKDIE